MYLGKFRICFIQPLCRKLMHKFLFLALDELLLNAFIHMFCNCFRWHFKTGFSHTSTFSKIPNFCKWCSPFLNQSWMKPQNFLCSLFWPVQSFSCPTLVMLPLHCLFYSYSFALSRHLPNTPAVLVASYRPPFLLSSDCPAQKPAKIYILAYKARLFFTINL